MNHDDEAIELMFSFIENNPYKDELMCMVMYVDFKSKKLLDVIYIR